jgi:hypothetical protein
MNVLLKLNLDFRIVACPQATKSRLMCVTAVGLLLVYVVFISSLINHWGHLD